MARGVAPQVLDGRILAVGPNLNRQYAAHTTYDATGQLVTPGLVDAHGHFYRYCTPLGGPSLCPYRPRSQPAARCVAV